MRFFSKLGGFALWLAGGAAVAGGPWDGNWYWAKEKSALAPHSFTLRHFANGAWLYDSGSELYLFKTDGEAWPEPLRPDSAIVARQPSPGALELTENEAGRPVFRLSMQVSAAGAHLIGETVRIGPDGAERKRPFDAIRTAPGDGFEGRWQQVPATPPSAQVQAELRANPFWVIRSTAEGEMRWTIPRTGEVLQGRLDRRMRPIQGPGRPTGEAFYWDPVSPHQIEFYAFASGHLVERATERLSDDGRTFTDVLWTPAYPDEKDVRVFERR